MTKHYILVSVELDLPSDLSEAEKERLIRNQLETSFDDYSSLSKILVNQQ